MKSGFPSTLLLAVLGLASLLPYLAALGLTDLRKNTLGFEAAFFGAFVLYLIAVALVLRPDTQSIMPNAAPHPLGTEYATRHTLILSVIVLFGVVFRLMLLPTRPTLSDDMYRYVWDGRVQAQGISPYRYPPNAPEIAGLRAYDRTVWRYINRKEAVTVYPPGAQLAFAGIWRIVHDSVTGFKAVFVFAELLGGLLLAQLLLAFGQPPERLLIYLWSPLLIFEVAHAGHVDGLMLTLLITAFWARVTERYWLLGICLGAATLVKFFPAILLPALLPPGTWQITGFKALAGHVWQPSPAKASTPAPVMAAARTPLPPIARLRSLPRPFSWKGRHDPAKVLLAFGGVVALGYLPYVLDGTGVLGFLPKYFDENFNLGLARILFGIAQHFALPGSTLANIVTFGGLAVLGIVFILRPVASVRVALLRCVWLIGWFTLFTQNLFSWYLLWLLPLMTLFVAPGKFLGLRLAPMSAWLIFSGTIMLSYMFFIRWRVIPWAQAAEYWPLYALLLLSLTPYVRPALARWPIRSEAQTRHVPDAPR